MPQIDIVKQATVFAKLADQLDQVGFETRTDFDGTYSIRFGKRALVANRIPDEQTAKIIAGSLNLAINNSRAYATSRYRNLLKAEAEQMELDYGKAIGNSEVQP